MTDYSWVSDLELNKRVAKQQGFTVLPERDEDLGTRVKKWHATDTMPDGGFDVVSELRDYCNNPTYAWPIIVENKISVTPDHWYEEDAGSVRWENTWEAEGLSVDSGWLQHQHANPLRAAMIVYLMLKEAR